MAKRGSAQDLRLEQVISGLARSLMLPCRHQLRVMMIPLHASKLPLPCGRQSCCKHMKVLQAHTSCVAVLDVLTVLEGC